ncbi:MAG: 1-acyl-sn-glycerol-3-phosphate acyltransferase [Bacilli bacterium]|nr:1-acyl-sn-glycerol-3-phosphate acyltransferase [Bacilli bacterium]
MDTLFYKIVRPIVGVIFKVLYRPTIVGRENIPKTGGIVLAGNHTKWLDPIMLIAVTKRQVHFLAKDELFHGKTKLIVKGMGCIPVNRKIHDKNALNQGYKTLENNNVIGIFPEGTINRTKDVIMPFKIGAVKMANKTDSVLIPFTITGKYKLFKKSIRIEFYKPIKVKDNLDKENEKLMDIISKNLIKCNNHKED